jgi:16S rRNA A1518/A1519 N6-dimethyltransferase RsmA/KsgA/DIM1 with predicted DNA glycosylase/AP lyase activity
MWPIIVVMFLVGVSVYSLKYSAVFIPMSRSTVKKILNIAKVGKGDVVYDLGCGDGRVLIEAAKKGARAVGIENNPLLYWICKRNVRESNFTNRIKVIRGNFFKKNLSEATVVALYLSQRLNNRLQPKLERELHNCRVVSADHTFTWKEIKRIKTGHFYTHLYKI